MTWLKQEGLSSFDVAGFTGMSEAMVERVYGKHDPSYQKKRRKRIRCKAKGNKVSAIIGPFVGRSNSTTLISAQAVEMFGGPGRT